MSLLSQFFPSGGGSKMDVDVFILSGGGGAAISGSPYLNSCSQTGHGGGGAVFQGTIPMEPGSTVPIVVGGGGAGHSGQPATTNLDGAIGGCSKITYPEGTLCVAGGGGGAPVCLVIGSMNTVYYSLDPTSPYTACRGTHTAGTGGSGGCICLDASGRCIECGLYDGPSGATPSAGYSGEGGRSIYGTGQFAYQEIHGANTYIPTNLKIIKGRQWCGVDVQNHKYGQFSGGAATGGSTYPNSPIPNMYNSFASGGAGSSAVIQASALAGADAGWTAAAGKGVCSCITGTLLEYGMGATAVGPVCYPALCDGLANLGGGGRAQKRPAGSANSGNGGSGTVIIRYPDQFAAAPSSPGANNCSPATPGYRTYRFTSSGSITLP